MKPLTEEERWIPGLEGRYTVTLEGKVHSYLRDRRQIRLCMAGGYLSFHAYPAEGKSFTMYLHRAMAMVNVPNPNGYEFIDHINSNVLDNRPENLEWVTRSMNLKRAYERGFRPRVGARRILSEDQVQIIRSSLKSGKELAMEYGVSEPHICYIRNGKRRKMG